MADIEKITKGRNIIAIDVGGTDIKGALVDRDFNIIFKKTIKTDAKRNTLALLEDIDMLIGELEDKADGYCNDGVAGIGMITPGYPDKNGIIPPASIPNISALSNFPIKNYLAKKRRPLILFENDGNAAAYGEYIFGQKKKYKNIIVLVLGTGVGSGVITDGKILRGKNKISGELSHIVLDPNGRVCCCGKKGCLEAYFSGKAIVDIAKEELSGEAVSTLCKYNPDDITPILIEEEAGSGDRLSKEIYESSGKWLGIAIANYINIFNPEKVILSGGLSKAAYLFWDPMMDEIKKNTYPLYSGSAIMEISKNTDNTGLIGAVSLFFR
jgi:glucokinase